MAQDAAATGDGAPREGVRVASAGSLILLQLFSRFLTLCMTQMQVRLTSAEVLGAASIHFELLLGTILTFSREGFRTSLSRVQVDTDFDAGITNAVHVEAFNKNSNNYDPTQQKEVQKREQARMIRNVAILPIPIGIVISITVMVFYTSHLAPKQLTMHPDFARATQAYLLGAILELLAEPLYIVSLMEIDTTTRVRAEGLAIAAKSSATLYTLWWMKDATTILPFGIGQVAYGLTLLLVYLLSFVRSKGLRHLSTFYISTRRVPSSSQQEDVVEVSGPKKGEESGKAEKKAILGLYDRDSLHLAWTMTRQNMVKYALGEGDKFAIARLASLSDQGAYALASNYGSLVARIIYQPIEESSRLTFARALGDEKRKPSGESIAVTTNLLHTLTSFYVLLSFFLLAFCPSYSTVLLLFLAGRRWAMETSAPTILAYYGTTYLPAMAFNGLLEGFLQACAPPSKLSSYSFVLAGASVLFVTSLATLYHSNLITAEKSLILSTTLSTIARAAYCYRFTLSFFTSLQSPTQISTLKNKSKSPYPSSAAKHQSLQITSFLPSSITLITFILSAVATNWHPTIWKQQQTDPLDYSHFLTGITCVALCVSICILYERATLLGTLAIIRGTQGISTG